MLAQRVLTYHLSSDSIFSSLPWIGKLVPRSWAGRFQLATAIRPDELVGILHQLAEDPSLGVLAAEINELLDRPNPVAVRQIRLMTETSVALKALALDRAPALITETVKTVRESAGYLESTGFSMTMDRISQQFATYIRIWTIVLSFALAGVTGLDALKLANDLYSKGDFRAALVGSAPNLIAAADKILPPGAQSDRDAVASAMSGLYADAVNKALANANIQIAGQPQGIKTRAEGEAWIRQNVAAAQEDAALKAYPAAVDRALAEFMKERARNAGEIQDILKASGIQIALGWPGGFTWKQLSGVLVSGALLSLGAPFWFNSLKAMTNLRPIVASKQKEEDKASA